MPRDRTLPSPTRGGPKRYRHSQGPRAWIGTTDCLKHAFPCSPIVCGSHQQESSGWNPWGPFCPGENYTQVYIASAVVRVQGQYPFDVEGAASLWEQTLERLGNMNSSDHRHHICSVCFAPDPALGYPHAATPWSLAAFCLLLMSCFESNLRTVAPTEYRDEHTHFLLKPLPQDPQINKQINKKTHSGILGSFARHALGEHLPGLPGYLQPAMLSLFPGSLCAFSFACPLTVKDQPALAHPIFCHSVRKFYF